MALKKGKPGGRSVEVPAAFVHFLDDFFRRRGGPFTWDQVRDRYGVTPQALSDWTGKVRRGAAVKIRSETLAKVFKGLWERDGIDPSDNRLGLGELAEEFRRLWLPDRPPPPGPAPSPAPPPRRVPPARGRGVRLTVGFASEYSAPFQRALTECAAAQGVRVTPICYKPDRSGANERAHEAFRDRAYDFDVMMVNDPWVPELCAGGRLAVLSELGAYREWASETDPARTFVRPLFEACEFPARSGLVYGLPILGNVQLLVWRERDPRLDGLERLVEDEGPIDPGGLSRLLAARGNSAGDPSRPAFAVRARTDEHLIENYWQVLRAYGHSDGAEEVTVVRPPAEAARAARRWLRAVDPHWENRRDGYDAFDRLVAGTGAAMTFAWPNWILRKGPRAYQQVRIGLHAFAGQPVMGMWMLTIDSRSENKEAAANLIVAVAAEPVLQARLARLGSVPVLDRFPARSELNRHWFWKDNYDTVMAALGRSRPLPRQRRWPECQRQLAVQLPGERPFRNVPGLLEFT